MAAPAAAETVYEITGDWETGTPATVGRGDVVNAIWRINVNDDQPAPSNDPVDNVTFTATLDHGLFREIPDVCLTDGVDPASVISEDGRTLTCNFGTVVQGTAVVLQSPVVVDGETGDQLTAVGEINGQEQPLDPIDIVNDFAMDMQFGGNTTYYRWNENYTSVDLDLQWALRLGKGSDQGPPNATYRLRLTDNNGAPVTVGTGIYGDVGCSPFNANRASGVPWSGLEGRPDRTTSFVERCALEPVAGQPGTFDLTLTGINYDLTDVPTKDSTIAGDPLPTDWNYIASGSLWLNIDTNQSGGITLQSNAPEYTSTTGLTYTDLTENNSTNKTYVLPGRWAAPWYRAYTGAGGQNWDDTYRVSAGTTVMQYVNNLGARLNAPPTAQHGQCLVFDTDYATYTPPSDTTTIPMIRGIAPTGGGSAAELENPPDIEYYVGNAVADPNDFDCGTDPGGWTTTLPTDRTQVQAVRISYPDSLLQDEGYNGIQLAAFTTIHDDVAVGQDVWMFGSVYNPVSDVWEGPGEPWDSADRIETPGARYPFTNGRRDIVRIISATPSIQKSADRAVVRPGDPATFTLTYSANGAGSIPDTVNDYEIVDTLPVGMSYVEGSADPAPAVTTNGDGQQVLTWSLDGVPTNAPQTQTYQAVASDSVEPGQVLTNTATSSLSGETSQEARAQVTVSSSGNTLIAKTTDQWFIANPDGSGDGEGSWTVTLRSEDPLPQAFTDTIDILPYNGDDRGTSYSGTYEVTSVDVPAGATVYYTTEDPQSLSDDPGDDANGAAGAPSAIWSTTMPENPTAVRVVGGELLPGATLAFQVNIATDGAEPGDVWVNRAQAIAEHTALVMRTSEPLTMGTMYSASLKKYVQDADGVWRDANDVADYPAFREGDTIPYRIVVENTGQGTLTDVEVSDDLQPELGAFTIDELAPGDTEAHEFEIVLEEGGPGTVVNTACAEAAQPDDSEDPVDINCDPAGFEVDGEPTHDKTIVSATPIGDGQWEVVYGIEVTNLSTHPTSYSLDDTLRFTDQVSIVSAEVTTSPEGVTLADPAWDGQGEVLIASGVPLVGNDEDDYAPHTYELTVIADVPLQLDGAGGDDDPTQCGPEGDDSFTAFNNTSAMTDALGGVEDDQACAELPSIGIDKSVSAGSTPNGDGTWTVTYDLVASNSGQADGEYDVTDRLHFGEGIELLDAAITTAPDGVETSTEWTGLGADDTDPENLVAAGVALAAGGTHTYQVEVAVQMDEATIDLAVLECGSAGSGEAGGLGNSTSLTSNGLTAGDDVCPTLPVFVMDKELSGDSPVANEDGTWTITYDVVAENVGAAAGEYDLSDELQYGEGIEILDTAVVSAPDGVSANGGWTGQGATDSQENVVASGVTLDAGASHTYQVQVQASVDFDEVTPQALACPEPGSGEPGGFANTAALTHNGEVQEDDACAAPTPPPASPSPSEEPADPGAVVTPVGSLPRTGATVAGFLALAVLLTLAGAYGVRTARRHTAS